MKRVTDAQLDFWTQQLDPRTVAACLETIRLWPPGPLLRRTCRRMGADPDVVMALRGYVSDQWKMASHLEPGRRD
jgi:hypothetical protein